MAKGLRVMVAALLGFLMFWNLWSEWEVMGRILRLAVVCAAGFAVYLVALFAVGVRLQDFKARS